MPKLIVHFIHISLEFSHFVFNIIAFQFGTQLALSHELTRKQCFFNLEITMNSDKARSLRKWKLGLGAAGLMAAAGVFGFLGSSTQAFFFSHEEQLPAAVGAANDLSAAFRYASNKVMPSIVMIRSQQKEMQQMMSGPGGQGDLSEQLPPELRRFFGEGMPRMQPRQPQQAPRGEGMGSGVIIDPSGIIMTNNHVVQGGGKITVRLHDGREFPAVEVKTDPKTDIAIVRIEGAGTLKAASLANSDNAQIGDWVLAVGAPFGLRETVTAGIISAKSRGIGINEREDFLQTDAAINPGNSGGPLVNVKGEVVGINTAISSRSGGNEGIGFAVPANVAKWVSHQLINKGTVHRAFLGVGIQPVTSELSKQFGLSSVTGAVVTEVKPESAAAKAGLETGDVIVEFDKQAVAGPRELQNLVERAASDQKHDLTIMRNGEKKAMSVNLQTRAESQSGSLDRSGAQPGSMIEKYGIEAGELTRDVAKQLGLEGVRGVVVTGIKPGSLADLAGLRDGMVITKAGQRQIKSLEDFDKALKFAKSSEGLLLLVRTQQGSQFLVLKNS